MSWCRNKHDLFKGWEKTNLLRKEGRKKSTRQYCRMGRSVSFRKNWIRIHLLPNFGILGKLMKPSSSLSSSVNEGRYPHSESCCGVWVMSVKWRGSVTVICWRIQTILWEALKERKGNWINDLGQRDPLWVFKQSGFPSYYLTLPLSMLPLWEILGPEFLLHTQESWTHHGWALVFLHRPACRRVLFWQFTTDTYRAVPWKLHHVRKSFSSVSL